MDWLGSQFFFLVDFFFGSQSHRLTSKLLLARSTQLLSFQGLHREY